MPRVSGSYQGEGIKAVLLALGILEYLSQHRGAAGVTELAQQFDTTKSRVHRHLQTLIEGGYVIQDEETERYRVSARLMALGEAIGQNFDLPTVARPVMDTLHARLGHSVAVSIPEPEGIRIVSVLRGGWNAEVGVRPGSLLSYHATAQGKLCLAFGSQDLKRHILTMPIEKSTSYSISTMKAFEDAAAVAKARGWATAGNEAIVGLNALAAPIFGAFGDYAGAIAIVDSVEYVRDEPTAEQIREVISAAHQISGALGSREAS